MHINPLEGSRIGTHVKGSDLALDGSYQDVHFCTGIPFSMELIVAIWVKVSVDIVSSTTSPPRGCSPPLEHLQTCRTHYCTPTDLLLSSLDESLSN